MDKARVLELAARFGAPDGDAVDEFNETERCRQAIHAAVTEALEEAAMALENASASLLDDVGPAHIVRNLQP